MECRKLPISPAFGSAYALTRFFMRLAIFGVFAALGQQGFARTLANLLILAVAYCVVAAAIRREQPSARNSLILTKQRPMPSLPTQRHGFRDRR